MQSQSVLVVDTDASVRGLLNRSLAADGHDVRTSAHALEALTVLSARPADVVICSLQLPGRDGRWLIEQLDRHHRGHTRVIICPPDGAPVQGLDHVSNIVASHPKPIDPNQLRRTLRLVAARTNGSALLPHVDRRCATRIAIGPSSGLTARLKAGGQCAVRDLSERGARIETESYLLPGRAVELQFGAARPASGTRAKVIRCAITSLTADRVVYEAGVHFDAELPGALLERLLSDLAA